MKSLSCVWLFVTPWTVTYQAPLSMGFPGKNTRVGCHFLLQGIFATQGLNPHLPRCRQILYCGVLYGRFGEGNGNLFSTLTWRIPWTEESGGLQSVGLQRVRHGLVTKEQQLYSTGNYSQYLVTAYINGEEPEKEHSLYNWIPVLYNWNSIN